MFDKETGTNRLFVNKVGSQIESGSYGEFVKSHKIGLKVGKIVIGAYSEKSQAQKSQLFYTYVGIENTSADKFLKPNMNDTLYCFYYTRPVIGDGLQPIIFQHIPARIAYGTQNEFLDLITEGLYYEKLAIGPFTDYELGEKSKFIFRKNGEMNIDGTGDPIKSKAIENMSKKWISVKIEMTKQANTKKTNETTYQLKVKFPSKYFVEDVFQTIIVKAMYSDSLLISSLGLTLQGNYVMDNNPVIPFKNGGLHTYPVSFKLFKTAKIKGFLFESFIYNNNELIDLDPVYIMAK